MRIACAWYGKDLGEKESAGKEEVTHGLCQEYLAKSEVKKRARPKKKQSRMNAK